MNLYPSIEQRKSCREYDMQPLGAAFLGDVETALNSFETLSPGFRPRYHFTGRVKGSFHVKAPHYLAIGAQGVPGEAENVGFLFQQLALWFDAMEIGCVWLGASQDAEAASPGGDILVIAFGRTTGPVHRAKNEFKRKPLEIITNAPEDACIQAARLAPSGMNTQPWYFEKQPGRVLLYKQKLKPPISFLYKNSDIDMGIGLCHYALACGQAGIPFSFVRDDTLPRKAGYLPFGVITQEAQTTPGG